MLTLFASPKQYQHPNGRALACFFFLLVHSQYLEQWLEISEYIEKLMNFPMKILTEKKEP